MSGEFDNSVVHSTHSMNAAQPVERAQLIEIKIKKINQLFNSFDPSPFLEKDMDDDAFEYIVSSVSEQHIKLKIKEGQLSFIVGIVFLVLCLGTGEYIQSHFSNTWTYIAAQGLLIGGWVAMWKPISDILYEWWPIWKEKRIFHKISEMDIEFRYT